MSNYHPHPHPNNGKMFADLSLGVGDGDAKNINIEVLFEKVPRGESLLTSLFTFCLVSKYQTISYKLKKTNGHHKLK